MVHQQRLALQTSRHGEMHDLTGQVAEVVAASGITTGVAHVFSVGSTSAVSVSFRVHSPVAISVASGLGWTLAWLVLKCPVPAPKRKRMRCRVFPERHSVLCFRPIRSKPRT